MIYGVFERKFEPTGDVQIEFSDRSHFEGAILKDKTMKGKLVLASKEELSGVFGNISNIPIGEFKI